MCCTKHTKQICFWISSCAKDNTKRSSRTERKQSGGECCWSALRFIRLVLHWPTLSCRHSHIHLASAFLSCHIFSHFLNQIFRLLFLSYFRSLIDCLSHSCDIYSHAEFSTRWGLNFFFTLWQHQFSSPMRWCRSNCTFSPSRCVNVMLGWNSQ